MRILHCCLSCFYIDGFAYQENRLVQEHVNAGHDVLVLASTEVFSDQGRLEYVEPRSYAGTDGAPVIRLPYVKVISDWASRKVRAYKGLFAEIDKFNPDIIMFHGLVGFALWTVARYARQNPTVKLIADSHEDFNNSRQSFAARVIYSCFYVPIIKASLKEIQKIYFITKETKDFCRKVYGLPEEKLEYLPLGGTVLDREAYDGIRRQVREQLGLEQSDLMILQTGKFDRSKRLLDSINEFLSLGADSAKFIIAGTIIDDAIEIEKLILDNTNVIGLGWVNSRELKNLMVASDIYLQPGTQSASMQEAVCSSCALVLYEYDSHVELNAGNMSFINEEVGIALQLRFLIDNVDRVNDMKYKSLAFAKENLDYAFLAEKVLG